MSTVHRSNFTHKLWSPKWGAQSPMSDIRVIVLAVICVYFSRSTIYTKYQYVCVCVCVYVFVFLCVFLCGGYVTCHWNLMKSYNWKFWIGGLSCRFSASGFCEFWKLTFCNFPSFFSFSIKAFLRFFKMCFIRSNLAYLCPNVIYFNVVDLSERRSEEVISFFWRSVYVPGLRLKYKLIASKHSCLWPCNEENLCGMCFHGNKPNAINQMCPDVYTA